MHSHTPEHLPSAAPQLPDSAPPPQAPRLQALPQTDAEKQTGWKKFKLGVGRGETAQVHFDSYTQPFVVTPDVSSAQNPSYTIQREADGSLTISTPLNFRFAVGQAQGSSAQENTVAPESRPQVTDVPLDLINDSIALSSADNTVSFKMGTYDQWLTFDRSTSSMGDFEQNGFTITRDTARPELLLVRSRVPFRYKEKRASRSEERAEDAEIAVNLPDVQLGATLQERLPYPTELASADAWAAASPTIRQEVQLTLARFLQVRKPDTNQFDPEGLLVAVHGDIQKGGALLVVHHPQTSDQALLSVKMTPDADGKPTMQLQFLRRGPEIER